MEKWRDVPGTDGKYQISIDTKEGRCRNTKTGRMLSNKPSQRDGRMHGNILACCKGKRKTAGGYKWNYAE